jgi:hypothetical protein
MNRDNPEFNFASGLLGAALGGALGYFGFLWSVKQGFYALVLPGALMGLGCAVLAKRRPMALAVACGVLALAVGIFCEWRVAPFIKDSSLDFFLTHLHQLRSLTLIMIVLGGVFAFWFARGSKGKSI